MTPSFEIKKHHIKNSLSKSFNGNLVMNDFETTHFSNDAHIDNETSNEAKLGEISPNEANINGISEREINLYLSRYLSVHPERIRIRASERVARSELDDAAIHAHDNIVEHIRDYRNLEFFVGRQAPMHQFDHFVFFPFQIGSFYNLTTGLVRTTPND